MIKGALGTAPSPQFVDTAQKLYRIVSRSAANAQSGVFSNWKSRPTVRAKRIVERLPDIRISEKNNARPLYLVRHELTTKVYARNASGLGALGSKNTTLNLYAEPRSQEATRSLICAIPWADCGGPAHAAGSGTTMPAKRLCELALIGKAGAYRDSCEGYLRRLQIFRC